MKRPKRIKLYYSNRRLLMDSIKSFASSTPFNFPICSRIYSMNGSVYIDTDKADMAITYIYFPK